MRALSVAFAFLVSACSDEAPNPVTPDADTQADTQDVTDTDAPTDLEDSVAPDDGEDDGDIDDSVDTSADTDGDADTGPLPCDGACLFGEICIDNECVCDPSPVSFKEDLVKPMQTTCGPGCHISEVELGGYQELNLYSDFAYENLISVTTTTCNGERVRVTPGSIRESYLYNKLADIDLCDGRPMPIGRMPWDEARLSALGRWICQGALDN